MAKNHNPEKGPRTPAPRVLDCEAWEAMLADALDGTLEPRDAEAFAEHSSRCAAGCAELLEEAKLGTEWLRFLRQTPEAPEGLLEKILAGTTGLPDAQQPLAVAGVAALPRQPWLGVPIGILQRHVAESRILMTLAMAFFSIALTLNLTGVHLNQVKFSDLKPATLASSVSHQYFTTSAHLARYYENLRIFYLLESQLNEIRHDNNDRPVAQPVSTQPQKPQSQPQSTVKPGGSARKGGSAAHPPAGHSRWEAPALPVLAGYRASRQAPVCDQEASLTGPRTSFSRFSFSKDRSLYPGITHKPSERSLV